MLEFFEKVMRNRIEQIIKSAEREGNKEADTSENIESLNVDETFLEVLNLSCEIKFRCEEDNELSKELRKKINVIQVKIDNLFQNVTTSTEIEFDDVVSLAITYYNISKVYIFTRDVYVAKYHLEKCMELLKGKELHPKAILISIQILLELNIVWRDLGQLENCYPLLDKAVELYLNYTKEEDEYPAPFNINNYTETLRGAEVETSIENSKICLIEAHILTLQYIEDLYCTQPKDKHKFVIYVHHLLNQQLNKTIASTENKVSLLCWAMASASLSTYFIHHDRFIEAKIHLAAANYMIARYGTLKDHALGSSENDVFEDAQAYVAKLWGMYGLKLLYLSQKRLRYQNDKSCEATNIKSESRAKSEERLMKSLIFVELEKDLENFVEITDTYVSSLDEAKVVFTNVLKWFDISKRYYNLESSFTYHVDIIAKICKAYKYYAYFEQSKSKRIITIKKQIKILEDTVSKLFEKCKTDEELFCCKIVYFDLAVLHSTFLDMKFEELDNLEEITDDVKMEIKQLAKRILDTFNLYLCLKA